MPSGSSCADGDADGLQHLTALADDDRLLGVALDDDLDADVGPLPLGHPAGDRVRELVAGLGQQLLADQLGDPERLGGVGDDVGREERRALGQPRRRDRPAARPRPCRCGRHREVLDLRGQARPAASTAAFASVSRSSTRSDVAPVDLVHHDDQAAAPPSSCVRRRPSAAARWTWRTERSRTVRSPGPMAAVASTTATITSTSSSASVAVSLSRVPSALPRAVDARRVDEDRPARRPRRRAARRGCGGASCWAATR